MSWHPDLEHRFFASLKKHRLEKASFVLMVSGGLDSMVMAELFRRTLNPEQLQIFHFHHGPAEKAQRHFRDQALALVQSYAGKFSLPMYFRKSERALNSEAECRQARREAVKEFLQDKTDYIVWAHHHQDLLETRLIRLIRGLGPKGLKSMAFKNGRHLRPLLHFSKSDLVEYAKNQNIPFLEDPSNGDKKYLRNWLREAWLPALEKKRPGALQSLAQSLELLTQELEEKIPHGTLHQALEVFKSQQQIPWTLYLRLTEKEQKNLLAHAFNGFGQKAWTKNHIEEAAKQLAQSKTGHRFRVAGLAVTLEKDYFSINSVG